MTLIENDHLGEWSPEKNCFWRLTFRHPLRKPSSVKSEDGFAHIVETCTYCGNPARKPVKSEDGFRTYCRNVSRQQRFFSGLQSPR